MLRRCLLGSGFFVPPFCIYQLEECSPLTTEITVNSEQAKSFKAS